MNDPLLYPIAASTGALFAGALLCAFGVWRPPVRLSIWLVVVLVVAFTFDIFTSVATDLFTAPVAVAAAIVLLWQTLTRADTRAPHAALWQIFASTQLLVIVALTIGGFFDVTNAAHMIAAAKWLEAVPAVAALLYASVRAVRRYSV